MGAKLLEFDAIIGNPPYQQMDDGYGASAIPLYNLFIEQAKKVKPGYVIMIVPSRWFSGGKGLSKFRKSMLEEGGIVEIHDYIYSNEIFPSVDIKGGINYFLWDRHHNGDVLVRTYIKGKCVSEMSRPLREDDIDIFIRDNMAPEILSKVRALGEESFSTLVNSRDSFNLQSNFYGNEESFDGAVKMFGYNNIGYVSRDEIKEGVDLIDKHKLFIGKAYGGDSCIRKIGVPIYGGHNTCCTETYYVIGPFENENICENVASYINTCFFQYMLSIRKIAQNMTSKTYLYVPMQDFSKPWTDEELYAKYKLSEEQIKHIEKIVPLKFGN